MKKKNGFTLVEVLVAGIVLAILMGVATTLIYRYTKTQNDLDDERNYSQEVTIIRNYFSYMVQSVNKEEDYPIVVMDNMVKHGDDILISFGESSYQVSSETTLDYLYVKEVKVEKVNDHLISLTIDDLYQTYIIYNTVS